MRSLENKRKAMTAQSFDDRATTAQRNHRNPLKTNSNIILSKEKESKEEKRKESTSTPTWEQYVDSLQQEQEWKDIMAMHTGLKQQFAKLYPQMHHQDRTARLCGVKENGCTNITRQAWK